MTCTTRMIVLGGVTLAVAAAVIVATAATASWFILLALVPLVMMVGCMVMMAAMARSMPRGPTAVWWRGWTDRAPVSTTARKRDDGRAHRYDGKGANAR